MKKWFQTDIGLFLLKAAVIYVIWYIIYDLWVLPYTSFDLWVIHQTAGVAAELLRTMHYLVFQLNRSIGIYGSPGLKLVNGCSGISEMALFAGLILAYPGRWIYRILFIMAGIGGIWVTNVARIIALALVQRFHPGLFQFTHHYSSTAVFYLVIFILLVIWVNWADKESAARGSAELKSTA